MENVKTLGKVLRIARIANDYKSREAAELAGVSTSYIYEVENGNKNVTYATLEKLCVAYKLSVVQIMELVEYYDSLRFGDSLKRYQLTLLKTLKLLVSKPGKDDSKIRTIYMILKIARDANRMTVQVASAISGVSSVYLSEIERGVKTNVSSEYLAKLADAYNLSVSQIEELVTFYESVDGDDERKYRLTLMKTLQIIDDNLSYEQLSF